MNQQPNNFNFDESTNGCQLSQPEIIRHDENEKLSVENILAHKKQLKRLLIILMGIGLSLGLVISIGIVILLNKLGLNQKPDRRGKPQPQIEQIKQFIF